MLVHYKPSFVREFNKLSHELQQEVEEKIALFKNSKNHRALRMHKLTGPLARFYSFSVNYRWRIVFTMADRNTAVLHNIGDHDVYNQ